MDQWQVTKSRTIRRESLRFSALWIIGTLVYLATNDPLLGVLFGSLHAGWSATSAGIWVLRSDYHRTRAWISLAFLLATASWQVATSALISVLFMMFADGLFGVQPRRDQFVVTMIALTSGVLLSTLIGLTATFFAGVYGLRIWINPKLREDVHGNFSALIRAESWPYRRFNFAIFVMGTSLVTPPILLGVGLLILLTVGTTPNEMDSLPAVLVTLGLVFVGPLSMIFIYAWLSQRIIARQPQECWNAQSLGN